MSALFMSLKMIPTETHGVPDRQKCALPRYTASAGNQRKRKSAVY